MGKLLGINLNWEWGGTHKAQLDMTFLVLLGDFHPTALPNRQLSMRRLRGHSQTWYFLGEVHIFPITARWCPPQL